MTPNFDPQELHRKLIAYLALAGPSTAADARDHLGISQPVFSRLVNRSREDLLVTGRARATRYAARRSIDGVGRTVPLYEVEESGNSRRLAGLHAIQPRGFYVDALADDVSSGYHDDLPWFLNDLRPSGFLGRQLPHRHPELEAPADIRSWSADDCLRYLTRYGWNPSGNLIIGEKAFGLYLENARTPPDLVEEDKRKRRYPQIASDVLSAGTVGSSAAGEQPKFLVVRTPGPVAVLVKFSPPVRDESGRRLADLLVCEHLAHEILRANDRPAARSATLVAEGRVFLEVERFDRTPGGGRRGLMSLASLDAEFVGSMRGWSRTSAELAGQGIIDAAAHRQIRWLECFGRLIGNTDMHPANLSFFTRGTTATGLAPAYDMLPMMYAPQGGQLIDRELSGIVPRPDESDIWEDACRAAATFWLAVSREPLVSEDFQKIARANAIEVESLRGLGRMLPR
jgi:hypothetical protein